MTGAIALHGVAKRFGEAEVIRGIDLDIPDGSFTVFVGLSGCGKSTLLRLISGLEPVSAGRIEVGGRDVTGVPPARRGLAMVFQSYALYPHMTVAENIGFGSRTKGVPKNQRRAAVERAAGVLQLGPYLDRRPCALSGGQRQRVAIGRCIVRDPAAFLFDEPLANLDAALRVEMRLELADLHRRLGTTMVYVTHDQVEAMTMASRIVVLHAGENMQVGAPRTLYERPANRFVAQFIGSPRMNVLPTAAIPGAPPGAAEVGVRPEALRLGEGPLEARVTAIEYTDADSMIHAQTTRGLVQVRVTGPIGARVGETLRLGAAPADLHHFRDDGSAVARHQGETA